MRGKSTENEVATGSPICSKDFLSLSAKFFFLLSANSAFVFFKGLVSFFVAVQGLSFIFNSFHDLSKAKRRMEER